MKNKKGKGVDIERNFPFDRLEKKLIQDQTIHPNTSHGLFISISYHMDKFSKIFQNHVFKSLIKQQKE